MHLVGYVRSSLPVLMHVGSIEKPFLILLFLDYVARFESRSKLLLVRKEHGKHGFVTATKLGTSNTFFVAGTKSFAAATKRFVDGTKHFVIVTKYFCYPSFNK